MAGNNKKRGRGRAKGVNDIFKVQMSLAGDSVLIYNRSKSVLHESREPERVAAIAEYCSLVAGDKKYFKGRARGTEFDLDKEIKNAVVIW